MGMMQPGGDPNLPEKTLGAEPLGESGIEHLERDHPVVAEVAPEIHHGHPAVADLSFYGIAALESGLKAVGQVEHGILRKGSRYDTIPAERQPDRTLAPLR